MPVKTRRSAHGLTGVVDDVVQPALQSEFVLDTVGLGLGIHTVVLDVLQDQESIRLMEGFIRAHPELWNEDIGV